MGLINSNKEVSKTTIKGKETFNIKLSLSANADIISSPKDIVLVLDRSGSMGTEPLNALKRGVNQFLDIIDKESDGVQDGVIGGGSRIGMVSFSTVATTENNFTTKVNELKVSVSKLNSSGSTNHKDAFIKAENVFLTSSTNEKILILFTDGDSNAGSEGYAEADRLKAKGITVFVIGLKGQRVIDEEALKKWASVPSSAFTLITPDYQTIEDTFRDLTANVAKSGASNIVLTDKINPCFEVVSLGNATKGTAKKIDKNTVQWNIDSLGKGSVAEGATFEFTVMHTGKCTGDVIVNASSDYTDTENNQIFLPDPTILIEEELPVEEVIEDCPVPVPVTIASCEQVVQFDAGNVNVGGLGRILQVDATIKNVCPFKDVALAVILDEVDVQGVEHSRGMKTMLIKGHTKATCEDIKVKCIKFVLPEEAIGTGDSLCNARNFNVRFIANYVDSGYKCCE